MKNLLIIMGFFLLTFTSCDNLLKENPHGSYTTDNYFSTESDALNALLYAYAPINYIEYGARFRFNIADVTTNQYTSYNKGLETGFYTWDINPNTEEFLYFFKYVYLSITRANAVLENVSTMNNIDPIVKEQFLGEAYFLRAFNYFMLVRTFGEVPLHEEVIKNMDMGQRSYASIETLYEFIISDLEEAISKMDIDKQPGRADKVAAQSLMSKVYLTMASSKMTGAPGYEWVSNYDEMYAKAAKYAGEVLYDQSTYGLEPDLLKIYDVEHQNDSIEHIFITSMSREGKGQEGSFSQLPQMYGIGGLQEIYISSSLDNKDDDVQLVIQGGITCFQYYRVDSDFYHSFQDNDLRKKLMVTTIYNEEGSVLANWSEDNLESSDPVLSAFYYPFSRKYTDPYSNANRTSANLYLIRFAEVALTYAEAVGPTTEGYYWINEVRKRAGLKALPENLPPQEFREEVWKELTFELAFEGHGLFELRRVNQVIENITNKQVNQRYAYFFPIPQREVDLNPSDNN